MKRSEMHCPGAAIESRTRSRGAGRVHCAPLHASMKQVLSSRLLQIGCGGFRARPRRHRLRSVESQARRSGDDFEPRFRRTSSEPEAEGGPLPSAPVVFERHVANQTQDTPNHLFGIVARLSLCDVARKKITENAALHPNEDPPCDRSQDRSIQHGGGVVPQVASGPAAGLTPGSCFAFRALHSVADFASRH